MKPLVISRLHIKLVELSIKFSNLLRDKIGKEITIKIDTNSDCISLIEFISEINKLSWASEVLENDHIKDPIILIIDNKLIQLSNQKLIKEFKIYGSSEIHFQIMFAGG